MAASTSPAPVAACAAELYPRARQIRSAESEGFSSQSLLIFAKALRYVSRALELSPLRNCMRASAMFRADCSRRVWRSFSGSEARALAVSASSTGVTSASGSSDPSRHTMTRVRARRLWTSTSVTAASPKTSCIFSLASLGLSPARATSARASLILHEFFRSSSGSSSTTSS